MSEPVVNELVSPARYTQIASSSSGFPILPIGAISFHFSISGISVGEFSVNSVPMYPGLMQFTRTPRFAHSIASDFVSWITPAFDALYAHCGCGTFTICAESYCSVNSLLGDSDNLEEFFEKKSAGGTGCIERWEDYLRHLSILINNLHMVLEHTVILGGHVAPYFTDEDLLKIRHYVAERSTFNDDTSYIIPGKCPGDTVAIGAALPFIKEFIDMHSSCRYYSLELFSEYFVFFMFFIFFSDYLLTFSLSCDIIISTKEKEDGPPIS